MNLEGNETLEMILETTFKDTEIECCIVTSPNLWKWRDGTNHKSSKPTKPQIRRREGENDRFPRRWSNKGFEIQRLGEPESQFSKCHGVRKIHGGPINMSIVVALNAITRKQSNNPHKYSRSKEDTNTSYTNSQGCEFETSATRVCESIRLW